MRRVVPIPLLLSMDPENLTAELVADRELRENALVTLGAVGLEIRQQPAALRYEGQQPPPRGMIFFVCFEVFRQLGDTRA